MAEEGYIGAADLLEQGDGAATPSIAEPIGNSGSGTKYQAPEISPATVASGDGEYRSATDALAESGPFEPARGPSSFARRALGDTAVSLWKGGVEGAAGVVGLADLATGGKAGKAVEEAGFDFEGTSKKLDKLYSPEYQHAQEEVEQADGLVPTLKKVAEYPSSIPNTIAESIPSMALGQGIGKAAMTVAPKIAPLVAGAIGEGAITAGQTAESVRNQTDDGELTGKQAALSAGTGALTGLITHVSGVGANKLGIGDVNTLGLRRGADTINPEKGIFRRTIEGGTLEAGQEGLQSSQEQIASNLALDKPYAEGVGSAAALGMVAGAGMGAPMAAVTTHKPDVEGNDNAGQGQEPEQTEAPSAPQPTPPTTGESTGAVAERTKAYVNRVHDIAKANPDIYDKLPLTGALKTAAESNGFSTEGKTARQVFEALDDIVNPKTEEQIAAREVERAGKAAETKVTDEINAALGDNSGMLTDSVRPLVEQGQTTKQKNTKIEAESGVLAAQEQEAATQSETVTETRTATPVVLEPAPEVDPTESLKGLTDRQLQAMKMQRVITPEQRAAINKELATRAQQTQEQTDSQDVITQTDPTITEPQPAPQGASANTADPVGGGQATQPAAQEQPAQKAKELLLRAAPNGDLNTLTGKDNAKTRAHILAVLTDQGRVPTTSATIPALREAFYSAAGIGEDTSAGQAQRFSAWVTQTQPTVQDQTDVQSQNQTAQPVTGQTDQGQKVQEVNKDSDFEVRAKAVKDLIDAGKPKDAYFHALKIRAPLSFTRNADDTISIHAGALLTEAFRTAEKKWKEHKRLERLFRKQQGIEDRVSPEKKAWLEQQAQAQANKPTTYLAPEAAPAPVQEKPAPTTPVDDAANLVVTSRNNAHTAPQEDIQNGNYAKAPVQFQNLTLTMENAVGSKRERTDRDGQKWEQVLHDNYGDIFGTVGADGDPIDVFVKQGLSEDDIAKSGKVFVVDQKDPKTGAFDEHKIMLGYNSLREAKEAYLRNYEDNWGGIKNITGVPMSALNEWLEKGDTKAPFKPDKPKQPRAKKVVKVDPMVDDLLRAIGKLGGVSRAQAVSQGLDVASGKDNRKFGFNIYPTFNSRSNETFDGMAETLRQYGFQGRDGAELDAEELLQMVSESVNQGVVHMTPEGNARLVAEMAEENYTQEQAQFSLRLQDLLVKAQRISEDEYKAMKEVIAKGYITPDNIDDEEADLDDYIARRSTENSETGDRESRGEEPLLQDYSQEELEQRNSDQKQKVSEIAEQEFAEIRRAVAAKSVDTIVDEMFGDKGRTEDVFGMTNPMQKPMFSRQGDPKRAAWSDDRVKRLMSEYAYSSEDNTTKAYATWVSPEQFLSATTPIGGKAQLESENTPLDIAALAKEIQTPFLQVQRTEEEGVYGISGHEGRHRMMALRDAGVSRVPIVVYFGSAQRNADIVEEPYFKAQDFGSGGWLKGESGFSTNSMTPISWAHFKDLKTDFGRSGADVQFSRREKLPETIKVNGVDRPTSNSNGLPIARTDEGVRNFWNWFGNSKVVDDSGRPLVVYHGTGADIHEFSEDALGKNTGANSAKMGFFFAKSPKTANEYALDKVSGYEYVKTNTVADIDHALASFGTVQKITKDRKISDQNGDDLYLPQDLTVYDGFLPNTEYDFTDEDSGNQARQGVGYTLKGLKSVTEGGTPFTEWVLKHRVYDVEYDSTDDFDDGIPYQVTTKPETHWFDSENEAKEFLLKLARREATYSVDSKRSRGSNVTPVYLRIENPRTEDMSGITAANAGLPREIQEAYDDGNDGVIFSNLDDGGGADTIYVATSNKQIKSAIGNNGDFSKDTSDIRFSRQKLPEIIEINGEDRWTVTADGSPIALTEEGVRNFWRWFGDSKVVDEDGKPLVLYHGTTGDFTSFDLSKANPESDLGVGVYMSNTVDDVGNNYAGEGPDLTSKLEKLAERIAGETDREYDDPEVVKAAKAALSIQNQGFTMPVFTAIKNPVVIGGNNETSLTYEEGYDEDTEEYGEPEGTLAEFMDSLRDVVAENEYDEADAEQAIGDAYEKLGGEYEVQVSDLIAALKGAEGLAYASNEDGDSVTNEIIREAFERIGFDGYIDHTVDQKFGSQRQYGKVMSGMDEDTVHYVAFRPRAVKSALGNSGAFGEDTSDIRYSQTENTETTLFGNAEQAKKALVDTFGEGINRLITNRILNFTQGKEDWPSAAQEAAIGDEEAVYINGRVYIDLAATSTERMAPVVLHEIGEHFNLKYMIGSAAYRSLQDQIANRATRMGSAEAKVWAEVKRSYTHLDEGSEAFVSEVIAKLGENNPKTPWYRRLLSQIKSFMMRYGLARGIVAGTITDADMHDLLTASLRSAARDLNRQKPALFGGSINPKFSFAGEGAYTADQDALERANSRLSKGEDAETVRKDTGWHQGDDGKMRFEIDDSKAEFSSTGTFDEAMMKAYVEGRNKTNGTRYTVTIGDLMAHKDLYDAYPELADITVTMLPAESPNLGEMATLENGEPTVRIREDLPRDEWASVILHELQHGIQAFEGFAIGGSVDDISQEDFAEAKRAKLTELMDTASAYTVMGDELAAASTRMQIRNLRRLATFEAYQRLSGEVEARNTQTRQNLSAEQRRDTAPRDTVDVDGKPIVVFANQAESSAAQFSRQDNTGTPAGDFEEAERSWLGQVAEKLDKMSDKAFSQRFAVLSVEQMAEVAQRYLPGLKGYVALQRERRAEIETVMRGADRLVTEVWKKLSKKEQHELAATMHDSTLADVDASKAWFGVENLDPKNPRSIRFKAFTQSVLTRYSQGELKRAAESLGAVSFNKNSVVFKTGDQANEFLGRLKEIEQNQSEALSVLEREDVNTSRKSDHALVAQKFAAMSKGAQQVYVETHEHHMSLFNRRIDALVQRIDDVVLDGKVKAAMIAEIRKEFESKSLNWYYAPLQRFGDYWIYGTNSEGVKVFSTYESERAWVAAEKRFKATGGELHGSGKSLSNLQSAGIEGVSDSFVADIQTLLNETLGEDDPAAKNLKDQVYQMYLDKLPSVSARHSSMHRKGTKGFELDAMRSFSHAIHHGATQLANMKYGREMGEVLKTQQKALDYANSPYLKDESLEEIAATQLLLADWAKMSQEGVLEGDMSVAKTEEDEDKIKVLKRAITLRNRLIDTPDTKAIAALERIEKRHKDLISAAEKIMPGDKKRASDIINEMLGSYQEALRTNSTAMDRIATGLNQFNFMWMLGFSLSAGIVNTLQTPGVAMPITAGRYGIARTISAYNRAYTEFMSSLTHQKLDDDGNVSITGVLVDRYLELIAAGKDTEAMKVAREIEAFELFKNGGDISKTRSFDLIGVGREGGLHGGAVHNLSMKAGWMFHHGERFNREVTLMANFRLATESGMDFSQAIEYARSVNNRAHLDYSSENASRIFRGATAKIAFQFKKYQQGMLYLWIKSATDALGKVDPDNYPNGKNDDGYKADVEKRIEARGTFMALLAMQSALAGTMGLPMVGMISVIYGMIGQALGDEDDPWDLEKDYRLGLSKLFGDQAGEALAKGLVNTFTDINLASRLDMKDIFFREPMKELEGRDAATAYAAQLLGPTGGSLAKLWQGFSFFAEGQPLRGAEAITPKFLGDLAKAARYATEGAKTLDGLPLKDMKDTESFMQAVGFGSSKLERMYAERDFVKKDEIAISTVRSKLVHRAAQAKIAREPVPMMEIRAFNMKHPTDQIKNAHILASKRAIKRNTKARGDRGYTVNRKLNYLLEENELLD
jgi:hypothetical protein